MSCLLFRSCFFLHVLLQLLVWVSYQLQQTFFVGLNCSEFGVPDLSGVVHFLISRSVCWNLPVRNGRESLLRSDVPAAGIWISRRHCQAAPSSVSLGSLWLRRWLAQPWWCIWWWRWIWNNIQDMHCRWFPFYTEQHLPCCLLITAHQSVGLWSKETQWTSEMKISTYEAQ